MLHALLVYNLLYLLKKLIELTKCILFYSIDPVIKALSMSRSWSAFIKQVPRKAKCRKPGGLD